MHYKQIKSNIYGANGFKLLFKISEVLGVPETAFFEFNEEILEAEKKK